MNTYTVSESKSHGMYIWILITFENGEYCDERTFMSRELAITEGMRWVNQR
jgi:hypothetical protein